jgi:DNA processing protein
MDDGALRALLTLRVIPGLGDVKRGKLLARHRNARAAARAALADLPAMERERLERAAQTCLEATRHAGARLIWLRGEGYPEALEHLHAAPTVLWMRGDAALLDRPAVAIVGTRRNTEYGAETSRMLAADLARAGVVVVSGLAHGIDRHAHEGALDAGGPTIAIVGCGIDVCYPHRNARLQERIARDGLLLSEFLPGERAMRHHFPRRNRLIAALSSGVVVVEAPHKSGALNTARHALELGREVFAVPGPVGRETSTGTNALIKDGACLVVDAADIMQELGLVPVFELAPAVPAPRSPEDNAEEGEPGADPPWATGAEAVDPNEAAILAAVDLEPRHADDIAERSGLSVGTVIGALLRLEVDGWVRQVPGLRFTRARNAA